MQDSPMNFGDLSSICVSTIEDRIEFINQNSITHISSEKPSFIGEIKMEARKSAKQKKL